MSDGIIKYVPNQERLKSKFRFWHVEPLLNQAADLLDRCRLFFKEYNSLEYSETQLKFEISNLEDEISLEKNRLELPERELIIAQRKKKFNGDIQGDMMNMVNEAEKLYKYQTGENQGFSGWTKAGQNQAEIHIQKHERILNDDLNQKQVEWSSSDKNYFYRKLYLKQVLLKKKRALMIEGKVLDFGWQKNLIREHFERDYKDALDRMFVAGEGMQKIYGYTNDFKENFNKTIPKDEAEVLTNAAIWTRDAIEWLVAYSQLDQSFTRVVSLFSLMTDQQKNDLHSTGGGITLSLPIPSHIFEGRDNIRLKGMGGSLLGNVGVYPWSIEVSVPKEGKFIRGGLDYPISQKLPACLLGRVQNAYNHRTIEICGLISLLNASPIGQTGFDGTVVPDGLWTFKITKPKVTKEDYKNVEDILLELNLSGKQWD